MFKLFSQRRKPQQVKPFIYDRLPKEFRVQVVHILLEVVGDSPTPWKKFKGDIVHSYDPNALAPSGQYWDRAFRTLTKEFGVPALVDQEGNSTTFSQCTSFILSADTDKCLDTIDVLFQSIDRDIREYPLKFPEALPDAAIAELNQRFNQHSLGYSFVHELIEKDSEYLHQEAVLPTFSLLRDNNFDGAEQEFSEAHKHFKNGLYKDAIVSANRAFESTLKTICDRKKWKYEKGATAKTLITLVLKNGLVPNYLETHFHALQSLLDSGTPVVRNKAGGHGQGEKITEVPEHLASYALNLAASNIVMLVESYKAR